MFVAVIMFVAVMRACVGPRVLCDCPLLTVTAEVLCCHVRVQTRFGTTLN